jgi:predicted nucleotidyltransferase
MTVATYELKSLRDKILSVLLPYKVKRVAVFGSVVRGEDTPDSDLDILVTLPPPGERPVIGLKWIDLIEELTASLGRPVDLVTEDGLSPYMRPHIEREMVILYEQD